MTTITSTKNPRVKNALRLRRGKYRRAEQAVLVDGARELLRAINAGIRLTEAFVCPLLCRLEESQQLVALLPEAAEQVYEVTEPVFERLAFGERREGVVAIAATPELSLDDLKLTDSPLVFVLEGVEKPGNIGAVARTADAIGADALIAADATCDLYSHNAIRSSLGTLLTSQICQTTTPETIQWLRRRGIKIFAARVDGSVEYTKCDYTGPAAIILGSEATGLTDQWQGEDIEAIRLPMLGIADSLNVSISAAVIGYEALRQRRVK